MSAWDWSITRLELLSPARMCNVRLRRTRIAHMGAEELLVTSAVIWLSSPPTYATYAHVCEQVKTGHYMPSAAIEGFCQTCLTLSID